MESVALPAESATFSIKKQSCRRIPFQNGQGRWDERDDVFPIVLLFFSYSSSFPEKVKRKNIVPSVPDAPAATLFASLTPSLSSSLTPHFIVPHELSIKSLFFTFDFSIRFPSETSSLAAPGSRLPLPFLFQVFPASLLPRTAESE